MSEFTPDWDRPLAPLHAMPAVKLLLISVLTAGLYNLVWFYRQWRAIEAASGNPKYPLTQALGSSFSVFTLARRVNLNAANSGARRVLVGALIPLAYVMSTPLALGPGVAGLLGIVNVLPLVALQAEASRGNRIRGQSPPMTWRLSWIEGLLLALVTPLLIFAFLENDFL